MTKKLGCFELDQIYCGDCLKLMPQIPEDSVDLIVTDPPFAIDFKAKRNNYNRTPEKVLEGYSEIPREEYYDFSLSWMKEAQRVLKKTGSMYVFSGWSNLKDILNAIDDVGFFTVNHLIWKYQFGVFTKRKFVTSHYHILFVVRDKRNYKFNKVEHYPEDVWEIKREYWKGKLKTPTKLPLEIVSRILKFSSDESDVVLDPFAGAGTVLLAAKMLKRHFLGFEIVKEYCKLARERLSDMG